MTARTITNLGFLSEFVRRHDYMTDRPFCWVLGSGASVQSGIPSGSELTKLWLGEMYEMEPHGELSIAEWATADRLGIDGFDYTNAARYYPWIYKRRFHDYRELGYAFLEKIMARAEPSFGYSVLAQIMATTDHKVAITTNFDNLVADALSIYTSSFPLVCGHESLTGYIRPAMRQPLVAKIHRDLLLQPLSNPDEIASLPDGWRTALKKIFERFTPVVIGYGGNDGSLMNFLKALPPIEGGLFWCHRNDALDPLIYEVVDHHQGRLVPIAGFDELMLQLQEKLKLPFLLPALQTAHDKRREDYQKQFELLTATLRMPAKNEEAEEVRKPVREAAEAAIERLTKEKNWWAWDLKAKNEPDLGNREAIYRAGLDDFPQSAALTSNFATFLYRSVKKFDEAERLFNRAIELDPTEGIITANFAQFNRLVREKYDEAERLYRRALDLQPNHPGIITDFAALLNDMGKDSGESERLYKRAVELAPDDALIIAHYATFQAEVRRNYDEAEMLYRRAVELSPSSVDQILALGRFLLWARKQYDETESLYRLALALDPRSAVANANLAYFLREVRKNYDEAESLYRHALDLDPSNYRVKVGFATLMWLGRKNNDEADRSYRSAIQLEPTESQSVGPYAHFLVAQGKTADARSVLEKARPGNKPSHAEAFLAYTLWLVDSATSQTALKALGRLKAVIDAHFPRWPWSFEDSLPQILSRLAENDRSLALKLADAISDDGRVAALNDDPLWNTVKPMPLSLPWSYIAGRG